MVDWGWVKPIERYLTTKNAEQQDSGLPERNLLAINTEQQGNDALDWGEALYLKIFTMLLLIRGNENQEGPRMAGHGHVVTWFL